VRRQRDERRASVADHNCGAAAFDLIELLQFPDKKRGDALSRHFR
jgi:hypothetical protein